MHGLFDSLRDESFLQPFPQSGLEFILQGHDDHRCVVVAAGFVCHDDEAIGHGREVFRPTEDVKYLVLVNTAGESVGAEQQHVSALDGNLRQIHVNTALDAEGFCHDVSLWRMFSLLFCNEPLEELFGDPGMVCGEGLDCPVSNEVEPAVSDMGDGEDLFMKQCGDHGGTHPGIVRPAP